jgi:hypothetical protein
MNITFTKDNKTVTLKQFLDFLNDVMPKRRGFTVLQSPIYFSAESGRKYIRIVESYHGSRSVYCFLDMDGNIYKSATWKAPAKHVRGTVFDANYSLGKGLDTYGATYLK